MASKDVASKTVGVVACRLEGWSGDVRLWVRSRAGGLGDAVILDRLEMSRPTALALAMLLREAASRLPAFENDV